MSESKSFLRNIKDTLSDPKVLAGTIVVAGVGLAALAYSALGDQKQKSRSKKLRSLIRKHFDTHKDDILKLISESSWNQWDRDDDYAKLSNMYEVFSRHLRSKRKGHMHHSEFLDLLKECGLTDEVAAVSLFKFWDHAPKQGFISFDRLVEGLGLMCRGSQKELYGRFYSAIDIDGDQEITREELKEMLTAFFPALEEKRIDQQVNLYFTLSDGDRDNTLDKEEFCKIANSNLITHLNEPIGFNAMLLRHFGLSITDVENVPK